MSEYNPLTAFFTSDSVVMASLVVTWSDGDLSRKSPVHDDINRATSNAANMFFFIVLRF